MLRLAAERGYTSVVHALLELPDERSVNLDTSTALYWAAEHGHADVVRLLLQHGVSAGDDDLRAAIRYGHVEMVQMLVAEVCEHGCNENVDNIVQRALETAAYRGQVATMRVLLEYADGWDMRLPVSNMTHDAAESGCGGLSLSMLWHEGWTQMPCVPLTPLQGTAT